MAISHMYRYCFSGTDFQFWEYDKLLPTAEILESPVPLYAAWPSIVCYWPKGLTEEWKEEYWKYIKKHPEEAAKGSCRTGRRESFPGWQRKKTDVRMIEQMIRAAAGLGMLRF